MFWRWQELSKGVHIPWHRALINMPILGHMYTLRGMPVEKLMANWNKFGGIFRLDSHMPTVWICNYEIIRNCDMQTEIK
jgi:hypothetical protein